MVGSMSYEDILQINDKCKKVTFSSEYRGRAEFRAGECVSLSCDGAQNDCSNITWLFGNKNGGTEELVVKGKVKSENNIERLRVTRQCSLEVKPLRKEDEGYYTCRSFLSSGRVDDHARHDLEIIRAASISIPATTTVKGAASTSKHSPTEPPPQLTAGVLLHVLVLLGFSVLTLVVLLRLFGWWRTRGNRTATEACIGLNSASDALPARVGLGPGAINEHAVDMDLDGALRGPSVGQRGGQRPVGSAQDQVDPGEISDAATYENMRAPPRCVGDTADMGIHFVTVHHLTK